MSAPPLCRLCVTCCNDFQNLYDEYGQANGLFEMTHEYFHPKIVDMEKWKQLTVICLECCRQLYDFHSFQSSVMMAQLKFMEEENKPILTTPHEIQMPQANILTHSTAIKVEEVEQEAINVSSDYGVHHSTNVIKVEQHFKEEQTEKELITFTDMLIDNFSQSTSKDTNEETTALSRHEEQLQFNEDQDQDGNPNISLPKLEIMDVDTSCVSTSDDEIPLAKVSKKPDKKSKKKYETLDYLLARWMPIIKCEKCPKTFPKWRLLTDHFLRQHPNEELCVTCCSRQISRVAIRDHLLLHSDPDVFKCDLCHNNYANGSALAYHRSLMHPESLKFKCGECGKCCVSKKGLTLHFRDMHNADRQDQANVQLLADGRTEFTCQLCGQTTYNLKAFKTHKWKVHGPNSSHQVCTICSKICYNDREFREHMAFHENKKLYKCAYCPRTYRSLTAVSNHRKRLHPQESKKNCYVNIEETTNENTTEQANDEPSTSA